MWLQFEQKDVSNWKKKRKRARTKKLKLGYKQTTAPRSLVFNVANTWYQQLFQTYF